MAVAPEVLDAVPFLKGLSPKARKSLASSMQERTVAAGREIVTEGTGGIAFFVILEGQAAVSVHGTEQAKIGPGDHFGEIALVLADAPRTATVTAVTDVRLGTLTAWHFKPFVREEPEVAWNLLETLARRVAAASVA